jgi:hypothetical protein
MISKPEFRPNNVRSKSKSGAILNSASSRVTGMPAAEPRNYGSHAGLGFRGSDVWSKTSEAVCQPDPGKNYRGTRAVTLWAAVLLTWLSLNAQAVSIWSNSVTPTRVTADANDLGSYEFGMVFKSTISGKVTGVRFYKGPQNTNAHSGKLWTESGTLLASVNFTGETASGWQQQLFSSPVSILADTPYVISYFDQGGGYSADIPSLGDPKTLVAGVTNLPLIALPNAESGNGVLNASGISAFPGTDTTGVNWWVDLVFQPDVDTNPPTVTAVSPLNGAINVNPSTTISVTFNEAMLPSSLTTNTITLLNASSNLVPATLSYTPGSTTVTLQPNSTLALGQSFSVRVRSGGTGVKDTATNALVSNFLWSFTVSSQPIVTIWSPTNTPPVAADNTALTLGVKFRSTTNGYIRGIRFYKGAANTGPHIANLWAGDGTKLGEATFVNETSSGWQEQYFVTPVAISSNTTYVASYFTPSGNYAFTGAYFATQGVTNAPLIALQDQVDGGNGVFTVDTTNQFPTTSVNSANYWVDVVFARLLDPDTNAPVVTSRFPTNGANNVSLTTSIRATFNEPMLTSTLNTNTFELRDAGNALVPASVSYDSNTLAATLQPLSALNLGATYTARVKGGVNGAKDTATNALAADNVWNFTTTASIAANIWGNITPSGTLSVTETTPFELGVRFRSAVSGFIQGIRFYKGTNNTGTHIGTLWTSSGTQLASVTFSNETATGWQQKTFATPVAITSNTTYVASYYAPNGGYAFDSFYFDGKGATNYPLRALPDNEDGPNGVFAENAHEFPTGTFNSANYWVDVVFTDQNTPPTAGTVNRTLPEDTSTNLVLVGSDAEGPVTFSLLSNPAHGQLSNFNTNTGALTYTPATNYFGSDTFNYRVSDGSLFATGTVNLTITAVNDPATADNKNISIPINTATNLVLTATDPDGLTSVVEVLAASATASPDNWTLNAGASKVAAVATDDGGTTYIRSSTTVPTMQAFELADPKFIQPGDPISSVTLRSTAERSGSGGTSFRTATVLGANTDYASSHGVGSSYNDFEDIFNSRPGGGAWTSTDVLNAKMLIENVNRSVDCTKFDALVTFLGSTNRSYTILSGPSHGAISGLNTNNGALTYTPTGGYAGPDSFTFRVNAGGVLSTGLVSITVGTTNAGAPPVVSNPIGTQNATYGTAFNFTFATNVFTDPDSPMLTYSATGMPPGINFTTTTRTFAGTPSASGNYPVSLVAADNSVPVLRATNVFDINVAKAALSVTSSNQTKPYGVPFSFTGREFFTSGLKFSDTATNATLNSAGAPANAAAGPYTITVTNVIGLGLTNYTISYFTGTMTVTPPAPYSITAISFTNNVATITWQSISGRVYRLEYKNDVTAPSWTEVPADVVSTGSSTTTTNATGGATNRFYRVK